MIRFDCEIPLVCQSRTTTIVAQYVKNLVNLALKQLSTLSLLGA